MMLLNTLLAAVLSTAAFQRQIDDAAALAAEMGVPYLDRVPSLGEAPADLWAKYVPEFNREDDELYTNAVPNSGAEEFLRANAPSFECPDKDIERTYHFRWWTYRKHLKRLADGGWVVTEFLPPVGWAGPENTINCASGHHIREGRWLADKRYVYEYLKFMLEKGRVHAPGAYAWWPSVSLLDWLDVTGETGKALALLPLLKQNYREWEKGWSHRGKFRIGLDASRGLFSMFDAFEGTELSLSGHGFRPLVNAAMHGEAKALSRLCKMAGDEAAAAGFARDAERLRQSICDNLWDPKRGFFLTLGPDAVRRDVCELHGYAPWYFDMQLDAGYDRAFSLLTREDGFLAPVGLTFPERSAKGFVIAYEGHECQWNGPSWPLATSVALTALAKRLHIVPQPAAGVVRPEDFCALLHQYAVQHRRVREDGTVVPWIDENVNPFTGDWISRTIILNTPAMRRRFARERGKDYNHSTFCDLVISGLVGFCPSADGSFEVKPLCPADWDHFNLENLRYRGRTYSIRYRRGAGVEVVGK